MKTLPPPKICPVCLEGERFKFIRNFRQRNSNFSLYECESCRVQFWIPFKGATLEWYGNQSMSEAREALRSKVFRAYHKKFLELCKDFSREKRILDLGCGAGEFIAELQKKGNEVWGVDFDKNLTNIAKRKFNLQNIYTMSFNDFFQKRDVPRFDIIVFFEVIEHLDNPLEFISNVKRILKPGGRIVLSTPERDRLLVNFASLDFPPHHLTRWNSQAISNLFQKINFKPYYVCHLKYFTYLVSAINNKFRGGLINKIAKGSNNKRKFVIVKVVHFVGEVKDCLIGFIPASFLWCVGKITKRKGGVMFVELKKKNHGFTKR